MAHVKAMAGINADGIEKMSGQEKTNAEKEEIDAALEAERRKQLEDQWNMGKLFVAVGVSVVLWGWMNGKVSWHFHALARLVGLDHFPLPADISQFFARLTTWGSQAEL